ncbi:MAG: hypothetical protein ACLS63_05935 [Flavonifractor plautii]
MHSSGKTPLIRLAKRDGMAGAGQWGIRIAAILLALVWRPGDPARQQPIRGCAIIVEAPWARPPASGRSKNSSCWGPPWPLPCFKMRFGTSAPGQITAGASPTYFALFWVDSIPRCPCCSSCAPPAPSAAACGRWCPPSSRPAGGPTRLCSP